MTLPHTSPRHPAAGTGLSRLGPDRLGLIGLFLAFVLMAGPALAVVGLWRATAQLRRPHPASFEDLLVAGAAWLLLLCAIWLATVAAAAVADVCSAERLRLLRRVGCPPRLRRAALALVGAALALNLPTAATAASPAPMGEPTPGAAPAVPHLGSPAVPVMGAAATVPAPGRAIGRRPGEASTRTAVVVRRGQSLWSIVADDLARDRAASAPAATPSTNARIARRVEQLHTHNRARIGGDPDVIVPGQRLHLPWRAAPAPGPTQPLPTQPLPSQPSPPTHPKESP